MLWVGFGSIGRGALPLLMRHVAVDAGRVGILAADDEGSDIARECGVRHEVLALTPANFAAVLARRLSPGDFLLNASVDVSSIDLLAWCHERGVHYIDAATEPWGGEQADESQPAARRSHHAYREQALAVRDRLPRGATAVLTHGANPGLVSHFVKQALEDLARDAGLALPPAPARADWARLAQRLGVKVIHVAECDGQRTDRARQPGEFLNTWSPKALCYEALQPAELGWGSHEGELPSDGRRFGFGSDAAIYLERAGLATRIRSWVPGHGAFHGWLISHNESISISDYFTVPSATGGVAYRPTCHYVYRPSDAAVLSLLELHERDGRMQDRMRMMQAELTDGVDELGVLLMGQEGGACWYGSQLGLAEARRLAPFNSATTLQVNASFVAGIAWALCHPAEGIVEPEEMDHRFVLDFTRPYLGRVGAHRTDWTPTAGRASLHGGRMASGAEPWQFRHFRVD